MGEKLLIELAGCPPAEVFSSELSKKVVNSYWQKLIKEQNLVLFSIAISVKDILRTLFLADKKKLSQNKQFIFLVYSNLQEMKMECDS